jgi:aryl-alcohol dehydrogenase-like predicted oxidoreductase
MEYRHLGKSGLKVSVVSLGAWVNFGEKINEDAVVECIKMARKAGIVSLFKVVILK